MIVIDQFTSFRVVIHLYRFPLFVVQIIIGRAARKLAENTNICLILTMRTIIKLYSLKVYLDGVQFAMVHS